MRPRTQAFAVRCLPRGWTDLGRQLGLFCGAYVLYRLVRGLVDGRAAQAFAHAREIVSVERSLHLFAEPAVQAWASGRDWLMTLASWTYLNSHFAITVLTLAWIYLHRNAAFYFVRNMFMAAMGMALGLYLLFPTAPPRLMPELGFTDPVGRLAGGGSGAGVAGLLVNPFAAVPSMHVCFAIMLGVPMARMVRRRWLSALWLAYPLIVSFVVVATANHWWLDAALGAAVAAVAAWLASVLVPAQPHAWAFEIRTSGAPA